MRPRATTNENAESAFAHSAFSFEPSAAADSHTRRLPLVMYVLELPSYAAGKLEIPGGPPPIRAKEKREGERYVKRGPF